MIAEKLYSVKVQVNFVNPLNPQKFLKEPKDLYRVQPNQTIRCLKSYRGWITIHGELVKISVLQLNFGEDTRARADDSRIEMMRKWKSVSN